MKFLRKLLNDKDEIVNPDFDMNSWKNLEYNDICFILSTLVQEYRGTYNLSQKELAAQIGCDKKYIIKLEAGKVEDISFRTLIEIWTKLSTPTYNFGTAFLSQVHNVVAYNHEQLTKRRYNR